MGVEEPCNQVVLSLDDLDLVVQLLPRFGLDAFEDFQGCFLCGQRLHDGADRQQGLDELGEVTLDAEQVRSLSIRIVAVAGHGQLGEGCCRRALIGVAQPDDEVVPRLGKGDHRFEGVCGGGAEVASAIDGQLLGGNRIEEQRCAGKCPERRVSSPAAC